MRIEHAGGDDRRISVDLGADPATIGGLKILAFDTATPATTVALATVTTWRELRDDPAAGRPARHASRLMPLVAELLDQREPGGIRSTGSRSGSGQARSPACAIGVATARALRRARLDTARGHLDARVAAAQRRDAPPNMGSRDLVVAVLDARRGEVFAAAGPGRGRRRPGARAGTRCLPTSWPGRSQLGASTLAIGDGAVAFREVLERSGRSVPHDASELHRVTAINHCRLAPLASRRPRPDRLAPDYQRPPDAKPR